MDTALVSQLLDRDWPIFVSACKRLGLSPPSRSESTLSLQCRPKGTSDEFLAILSCDDYDAQAPLLDFADPSGSGDIGRQWWPQMAGAPNNSIVLDERHLPILCVPGT